MMRFSLAAVAIVVLALGATAAACGGGDGDGNGGEPLTLQAYFERLGKLDADFEVRTDALDARLDEDLSALDTGEFDAAVNIFVRFFEDGVDAINDFIDDLEDLRPPPEVEEAHEAEVAAGRHMASAFEGLSEKASKAGSEADLNVLASDTAFVEAGTEFDDACAELQTIADLNEVDVDLDCEDVK